MQKNGLISLEELENAITDKTSLVSVMGVNNEIGVMQPLKEIGALCRKKGVFFHSDCAQMFGKVIPHFIFIFKTLSCKQHIMLMGSFLWM